MLRTSPSRLAAHADAAALVAAFVASGRAVTQCAARRTRAMVRAAARAVRQSAWLTARLAAASAAPLRAAPAPAAEPVEAERYTILARNGFTFTSEHCLYVIRHHGARVMTDMNKMTVEDTFLRLSRFA